MTELHPQFEVSAEAHHSKVAHLSADDGRTSLCGAPIQGIPTRSGTGRCCVCIELAQQGRHHQR